MLEIPDLWTASASDQQVLMDRDGATVTSLKLHAGTLYEVSLRSGCHTVADLRAALDKLPQDAHLHVAFYDEQVDDGKVGVYISFREAA